MAATTDNPSTEISLVDQGIAAVKKGTALTISDLMAILAPKPKAEEVTSTVPLPKKITPAQAAAMERVPEVFGKVVPTEPRLLVPTEVKALIEERMTLDEVKKMAESRLKDITIVAHNHMDREYEAQVPDPERRVPQDKDGHYIEAHRAGVPEMDKEFSRETRGGTPTLVAATLQSFDTGEEDALLTHAEYLSMTTQVRVVDPAKVMAAVKKNPRLVEVIARATEPGVAGTSVYLRNKQ